MVDKIPLSWMLAILDAVYLCLMRVHSQVYELLMEPVLFYQYMVIIIPWDGWQSPIYIKSYQQLTSDVNTKVWQMLPFQLWVAFHLHKIGFNFQTIHGKHKQHETESRGLCIFKPLTSRWLIDMNYFPSDSPTLTWEIILKSFKRALHSHGEYVGKQFAREYTGIHFSQVKWVRLKPVCNHK